MTNTAYQLYGPPQLGIRGNLANKAENIEADIFNVTRLLIKGSDMHDNLTRAAKSLMDHESNLIATETNLKQSLVRLALIKIDVQDIQTNINNFKEVLTALPIIAPPSNQQPK